MESETYKDTINIEEAIHENDESSSESDYDSEGYRDSTSDSDEDISAILRPTRLGRVPLLARKLLT